MRDFSLEEQRILIAEGRRLMSSAGAFDVNAFRAGSFGLNRDTLRALALNGIKFDTSYDASSVSASDVGMSATIVEPTSIDGVNEYPMTVFDDGTHRLRHVQITACSYRELEAMFRSVDMRPVASGGYARFFTELAELVINFGYVKVLARKKEHPPVMEGTIAPTSRKELEAVRKEYRMYSLIYPFMYVFSLLDKLIPGRGGYAVAVSARK